MRRPRELALSVCFQPLQRKLADCLQHSETVLAPLWGYLPHQGLVNEAPEREHIAAVEVSSNCLGRLQCESAGKDR